MELLYVNKLKQDIWWYVTVGRFPPLVCPAAVKFSLYLKKSFLKEQMLSYL
jgi:hypothetical protein